MANSRDRILIVESEPAISDLIGRQALQAVGYQVQVATDATSAIARALQWAPDLLLVDLSLPGLSGKDLLVALASPGVQTPLIILARRGSEADIIQTFRLGAADYLLLPAREAEVVNAVNRVLKQVHDRRERERLAQQLQQANQDLQSRVRELTTIFALGKAMTSVTDQAALYDRVLEGGIRITQADLGWLLLREDAERPFLVVAEKNLPPALGVRLYQPWDDGISSLVAMSGEPLTINGEALKRFKISSLGLSALIVPVKAQKKVIGLLVMLRKQPAPFAVSEQHLLEALADYASISLVNARLFRAVEDRARSLQQLADTAQVGEKVKNEILRIVKKELARPVSSALAALLQLSKDPTFRLRPDQRQHLATVQDGLLDVQQIAEAITPLRVLKSVGDRSPVDLADLLGQSLRRLQPYAGRAGITLTPDIPTGAVPVSVNGDLIAQALDGAICSAIKAGGAGEQARVCLQKMSESAASAGTTAAPAASTERSSAGAVGLPAVRARLAVPAASSSAEALLAVPAAHLLVISPNTVLSPNAVETAFAEPAAGRPVASNKAGTAERFGGLGISLYMVKEIVSRYGGKIWIESRAGKGTTLHILLPLAH